MSVIEERSKLDLPETKKVVAYSWDPFLRLRASEYSGVKAVSLTIVCGNCHLTKQGDSHELQVNLPEQPMKPSDAPIRAGGPCCACGSHLEVEVVVCDPILLRATPVTEPAKQKKALREYEEAAASWIKRTLCQRVMDFFAKKKPPVCRPKLTVSNPVDVETIQAGTWAFQIKCPHRCAGKSEVFWISVMPGNFIGILEGKCCECQRDLQAEYEMWTPWG